MKRTVLFSLFLLFFLVQPGWAQFGLKLAPVTGLNFNIGTGSDLQQTGTGLGMVVGAQTDMQFSPVIGIIASLQFYDVRSWSMSEQGNLAPLGIQGNGTVKTNVSLGYFVIEPLLKLSIPQSGFYFIVGPGLGINIQGSTQLIVTPQGQQVIRGAKQTLQNTNARFELKAGAGFDIPLGTWIDLTPQFSFGFGVSNIIQDFSARVLTFQLSTAVKFKLI
jgi:hypothetical protein